MEVGATRTRSCSLFALVKYNVFEDLYVVPGTSTSLYKPVLVRALVQGKYK